MKTCVINVYDNAPWINRDGDNDGHEMGKKCATEYEADFAACHRSFDRRFVESNRAAGKLLRSAGVAYRLRVTMKDKS